MGKEFVTFGGLTTTVTGDNEEKEFDEVYNDDGRFFLESCETFEHREEGLNFDYKYCISGNVISNEEFLKKYIAIVELVLVPLPDSLCNKAFEEVLEWCGVELKDIGIHKDIGVYDVCTYFGGVTMGYEPITIDNDKDVYDLMELDEVKKVVKAIEMTYRGIDSLRGFYLDKPLNLIGDDGWGIIKKLVLGDEQ